MKYALVVALALLCFAAHAVTALNNGVALTPPMGWLSWERFRCETDCKTYPDSCISENLYMAMADELAAGGFLDVGYQYVNIDDCWANMTRDANGYLQADSDRFPSGIKALADYVHAKGLKLGIYTDIGSQTCGGYPGSGGYFEQDAKVTCIGGCSCRASCAYHQTFAAWGIDSVKVDGCNAQTSQFPVLYPQFGKYLAATGRPMMYSCSWPAYIQGHANFTEIAQYCNLWRAYDDIQDSWGSVVDIINWWASNQAQLIPAASPSAWNDPDMLIIGDFALSDDDSRSQMTMWAMFAAPMLMSNDLRAISDSARAILQNTEVIAVNQDSAGLQGKQVMVSDDETLQWWVRQLGDGSYVVAILNLSNAGSATIVTTSFTSLDFKFQSAVARDLWAQEDMGTVTGSFDVPVNPHGVAMIKLTPQ